MKTNLIVQLSVISTDQLFSTLEAGDASPETLYLTQRYRANPEAMNTIPIPVRADSAPVLPLPTVTIKRRYQVLANHHIFFARKRAQCPFVLCLCLNQPEQNPHLWQAELQSKSQPIKFNISTMEPGDLVQAFGYLSRSEKGLATLRGQKELIQAVAEHPGRPYWSSWDPIKALAKSRKVSMTPKQTACLDHYFFFDPQALPRLCINTASAEELGAHLPLLPLAKGLRELIQAVAEDPGRPYWSSWYPIKALAKSRKVSMTPKQTACLDHYFFFDPQALPRLCINTASAEELGAHLPLLPLAKGFVGQLFHGLSSSPSRCYWRDVKDMTKVLRAEAQLAIPRATQTVLAQGFHFTPEPLPSPNTVAFLLQGMSLTELRREAQERGLACKGMKKSDLVQLLSSS